MEVVEVVEVEVPVKLSARYNNPFGFLNSLGSIILKTPVG